MMFYKRLFGLAVVFSVSVGVSPSHAEPSDSASQRKALLDDLVSSSHVTRIQAAESLVDHVPRGSEDQILKFIRLELEGASRRASTGRRKSKAVTMVPFQGDEASLFRIKADPRAYVDRPFVLCGAIEIGDYYLGGYDGTEDTHYSFVLHAIDKNGKYGIEFVHLYMSRDTGPPLVDEVSRVMEAGFKGKVVRVLATIVGGHAEKWDEMELFDWQVLGPDGQWLPWKLAGARLGFKMLRQLGDSALHTLVDVVMTEESLGSKSVDYLMRQLAIESLSSMPTRDKKRAVRLLERAGKRARSTELIPWRKRACSRLGS